MCARTWRHIQPCIASHIEWRRAARLKALGRWPAAGRCALYYK
jgi:hypothetical protein